MSKKSTDRKCYNGVMKRGPSSGVDEMSTVTATRELSITVPLAAKWSSTPTLNNMCTANPEFQRTWTPNMPYTTFYNNQDKERKGNYPSTNEWIKKNCNMFTMQPHSGWKKNVITPISRTYLELGITLLTDVMKNQKGKNPKRSLTGAIYMYSLEPTGKQFRRHENQTFPLPQESSGEGIS